jgi:Holliday junction resolvase-like predicted endonuclease
MASVAIWEIDSNSPSRLGESSVRSEADLESWIAAEPALLEEGLEIVGRQISLDAGRLDLLALDPQGSWVVVEIKRGPAGRNALAQALDYASCIRELPSELLRAHADAYLKSGGRTIGGLLESRDALDVLGPENRTVKILIVGVGHDANLDRIVRFAGDRLPIKVLSYDAFRLADGRELLVREITEAAPLPEDDGERITRGNEEVQRAAEANGVGPMFAILFNAGKSVGLNPRPFKNSIMFTPPENKRRMLFTMWARPRKGRLLVYVGRTVFSDFYPFAVAEVAEDLGEEGWRLLDKDGAEDLASGLRTLFSRLSTEASDPEAHPATARSPGVLLPGGADASRRSHC